MAEPTCVIIGGGPAGMMLGLLLARAGVRVEVLEQHGDFLRDFRGDTVHPSTLRLLDELGLGRRFEELPHSRLDEVRWPVDANRSVVLADLRRLRQPHPYIAMVPQWDLLNLLADAARQEPSFTLRMDTEVTGLIQASGRVLGVRYRTSDGTTGELPAALTVACDGRRSIAHTDARLRPREFRVPMDAWWLRLPRLPQDSTALTPRAAPGQLAVVIPRAGYLQIAYLAEKGADQRLRAAGIESFRRDLAALMPELAGRLGALASMDDVKHLDVRLNRLQRWHTDGLLCIGDAAHAMSPVGGVGINLAVQDAVAAATLLAGPLRHGTPPPATLAAVRARRLLPTVAVQTLQRLLHRGLIDPTLAGRRTGPPAAVLALLRRFPRLAVVPAYLIGVGIRSEHAPWFARGYSLTSGEGHDRQNDDVKELMMKAKVGDRIIEEGTHVGDHRRVGVVTALRHDDGTPPYEVHWLDTGNDALVFPGGDARVEPGKPG
ncbi:FAD-dependent oxidoreductase [Dactylosporangium siamense]|uniref:Oxidoreductase n=1 Tax=Dactylosporangium siamense TaxID=685454 RepID=A0A919UBA2_9ACTN|nr:FAD-dependent oxidoreductase [Dactylosporangium siamense]GIG45475.1 oxidoreductase [Dactylosporangium siamense]